MQPRKPAGLELVEVSLQRIEATVQESIAWQVAVRCEFAELLGPIAIGQTEFTSTFNFEQLPDFIF